MEWKEQSNPKTPFEAISYSTYCAKWFMKGIAANKTSLHKNTHSFLETLSFDNMDKWAPVEIDSAANRSTNKVKCETTEFVVVDPSVSKVVCSFCKEEVDPPLSTTQTNSKNKIEKVLKFEQDPYDTIYLHCCGKCYND